MPFWNLNDPQHTIQSDSFVPYVPRLSMNGAATTDITSVTAGAAADGTFNEQYIISGNTLPTPWPEDVWGKMAISSNTNGARTSQSGIACSATKRFMCDGNAFAWFGNGTGFVADIYIDGRPYANNPVTLTGSTGYAPFGFVSIAFPSAKPRLIEIRSTAGTVAVYAKKPYRVWKPSPDPNPKVAVVGDSYVAPTVKDDTTGTNVTSGFYDLGIWQKMPALLGITSLVTDGIGGTGYLAGGGSNLPYTHSSRISWLQSISPDVIVMHGGGANDLYNSYSVSAITTAVVSHFENLRTLFPNAKLVFVEGIAPPLFTPGTYNPNFVLIRQGVQAALNINKMYYLDVATTRAPLNGTGYVTATNGTDNTNIYVGSDATHLTAKGNQYIRHILAAKMTRVLADDGSLSGQLLI